MTRSEWDLAEAILNGGHQPNRGQVLALAQEVLRLRDLAEVKYELLRAERGLDVLSVIQPRIDKLYMQGNAAARGETKDAEGDPVELWNRLVELVAHSLVHWVAAERWAVLEHRKADEMRSSLAMVDEGAPIG